MEKTKRALAATLLSVAVLLLASPYAAQMVAQTIYPPSGGGVSGLTCSATTCTFTLPVVVPDGSALAPSIRSATSADGFYFTPGSYIHATIAGLHRIRFSGFLDLVQNSGGVRIGAASDVIMVRDAAANLQLGNDADTAVAQTISAADSLGAGVTGGSLTLSGGAGGAGGATGNLVVGSPAVVGSNVTVLTDNTKAAFTKIAVANSAYGGGVFYYSLFCADASDRVTRSGLIPFSVQGGDSGTETCSIGTDAPTGDVTDNAKAFTTVTWTCADGGTNLVQFEVQADCTIGTPTDIHIDVLPFMPITKAVFPQT